MFSKFSLLFYVTALVFAFQCLAVPVPLRKVEKTGKTIEFIYEKKIGLPKLPILMNDVVQLPQVKEYYNESADLVQVPKKKKQVEVQVEFEVKFHPSMTFDILKYGIALVFLIFVCVSYLRCQIRCDPKKNGEVSVEVNFLNEEDLEEYRPSDEKKKQPLESTTIITKDVKAVEAGI